MARPDKRDRERRPAYRRGLAFIVAVGVVIGLTGCTARGGGRPEGATSSVDPSIELHAQYAIEEFGERGGPYTTRLQTVYFPPNAQTTIHRHYGPEMHYFQEGEFAVIGEQGTLRFRAGDSYVVPPGIVHRMRNVGTAWGRVLNVSVIPEGRPTSEEIDRPLPE